MMKHFRTSLFWLSAGTLLYTFFGYPALIAWLARRRPRPVQQAPITPTVTMLIPAYNEAAVIAAKIENSLSLDYPADRRRVVIVADGSTDETAAIARRYVDQGVQVHFQPERRGKIAAVNRVMPLLTDEIVVMSDANAMLDAGTLRAITRNFADPDVTAVAGEKRVLSGGEGLYWRYESFLKRCDSAVSSVMGAAGELFAIRRTHYLPPEADAIIEDFLLSMRLVARGERVVYEPDAIAREEANSSLHADWQRRTRIAAGGFQSIARLPMLLHPRAGMIGWQYVSHRVLRWAVTPLLLPLLFVLNWTLWKRPFYRLLAIGQSLFYGLALWGYRRADRGHTNGLPYTIFYFCFTNLAALAGLRRYLAGKQPVTWEKVR